MAVVGQEGVRQTPHDPRRSQGGLREAGRMRRGFVEFLKLPLLITTAFAAVAVLMAVLDATGGPLQGMAAAIVPGGDAVEFVSAVATSIVTVTSITFSVLLVAVQQTATALTAVVFDQFLRRRANQVYFGFFVGLSAYSFLVLGLARSNPPPVYGAALCLVLTIAGLVVLLLLIYGTVDQMRPQSVVQSIHELARHAREHELVLLGRTKARRATPPGTPERAVITPDSGYVVSIDLDRLARVAQQAGTTVEVLVDATLGIYLRFGEVIARLAGADPNDDRWDYEVRAAFRLDNIRNVDAESGYAIDQLENIAWTATSSAHHSPQTAVTAVRALDDLLARWLVAGERDRSERAKAPDEEPIVYIDGAVPQVLGTLARITVASAESRQAQTCAEVMLTFAGAATRLETDSDWVAFNEALDSCLPAMIQHAEVPILRHALEKLDDVLGEHEQEASRVADVRRLLSEATRRLLPKPSDDPEAAHPE